MKSVARGFTLIEMSIVLVIIGLIVGGILTGRQLIRTSELHSLITDELKYITAVNTFRTKYGALPGDMLDATNIWGADPQGCPYNAPPYTAPQITTCNGNGNGLIQNDGTGENNNPDFKYENFRAWQQLADAKLIPGAYTGTPGLSSWTDNELGLNVPATKISNGGFEWTAFNASARYPATIWNAQYNTQYLLLGGGNSGTDLVNPLLSPQDAQAIDSKIDDGLSGSGNVLGSDLYDSNGSCLVSPAGPYNVSNKAPYCTLLFMIKSW